MRLTSILSIFASLSAFSVSAQSYSADKELDQCRKALNCLVFTCESQNYTCFWENGLEQPSCVGGKISWPSSGNFDCELVPVSSCQSNDWRIFTRQGADSVIVRPENSEYEFWRSGRLERGEGEAELRCNNDIQSVKEYVSIRHGSNLDLFWFVGFNDDEPISLFARLQDGEHLGVTHNNHGPLIHLGRNKDLRIQYCFDGRQWTSSAVNRVRIKLGSPAEWEPGLECRSNAVTFFDGETIEYDDGSHLPPTGMSRTCRTSQLLCRLPEAVQIGADCSCPPGTGLYTGKAIQ